MKPTSTLPANLLFGTRPWFFPLFTLWALFIFSIFFASLYQDGGVLSAFSGWFSHRVPDVAFFQRWLVWKESLTALMTGLLVTGILWSCGSRVFSLFSLEAKGAAGFCLKIGLGVFLLNLFWMGSGLVCLWFEPLWLVGFILLALLFLKDLLDFYRQGFSFVSAENKGFWLGLLCLFYALFLLLHSLLPETFYDSLNYFLGMPSFWLWHHGIHDYPTHLLSGYFHGGSLFFMNGFVLAGTEGAKVLAAFVLLWTALFSYGWVSRLANPAAGMTAATAILTFPLLYLNSWAVRVDGLLCLALLLFLYALERGASGMKGEGRWILLAGLFMGLAISIKPTAVTILAAAILALLWRDGWAIVPKKEWLGFGLVVLLEVGPWLLKNASFTGNPFFPYAISWMGGRQFPAWGYQRLLHENQQFLPMDHGALSVLSLPWRLTMPAAGDGQFIGPLLLAFLPLLVLFRFQDSPLRFLNRVLLLSLVLGLGLSHMLRFSLPSFVLAFLILSAGVLSLDVGKWRNLWTGAVVLSALLCFGEYLLISSRWYDGWGIWSGKEERAHYLSRMMNRSVGELPTWIDSHLPKNSRILAVGDAQVLYFPRSAYANSAFDDQFFSRAAQNEKDAFGILRRLKELGISHVVFNKFLGAINAHEYHQYDLTEGQWRNLGDFTGRGLEPLYVSQVLEVYRVRESLLDKPENKLENPFLFFPVQALDFQTSLEHADSAKAQKDLDQLLRYFPGDSYWTEKKKEMKGRKPL